MNKWIVLYLFSIVLANILILQFGSWMIPIVSFLLIGFDLVVRDKLTDVISKLQMFIMILISGLITFIINSNSIQISIASSLSFTIASLVDWYVFVNSSGTWSQRSYKSNIFGATVDSLIFPTIAFGSFILHIVVIQIITKIIGSAMWVYLIRNKSGN